MTTVVLERCLNILKTSKSDNELLAALLMVTKVAKAEDCDEDRMKSIFDAVGFKFLSRLLRTGGKTSTSDETTRNTFKSIAVNIISSFCALPGVIDDPDLSLLLPHIAIIVTQEPADEAGRQLVNDSYECLSAITALPGGAQALVLSNYNITPLCQAIIGKCYGHMQALQLLIYLCVTCGSDTWEMSPKYLKLLIEHITQEIDADKTERKFELCSALGTILISAPQDEIHKTEYRAWRQVIQQILFTTLTNRLASAQRNPVVTLCSIIVDQCSIVWAIQETDCKFLLLLVHMACIEVRMALDTEDIQKISGAGGLLAACYSLLEHVIGYMTGGPSLQLNSKQITQLHAAMVGAFNAVISFLSRMSAYPQCEARTPVVIASVRVLGSWLAEETSALKEEIIALLPFLIQIGQDTLYENVGRPESLPPDTEPDSNNQLSNLADDQGCDRYTEETNTETNGSLPPKSPACIATQSNNTHAATMPNSLGTNFSPSKINSSNVMESTVRDLKLFSSVETLQFLMPGFCHLSAEEGGRKVMLTSNLPQLLCQYMTYQFTRLQKCERSGVNKEPEVALLTTCGVLLNFVVLEGRVVADSAVFSEVVSIVVNKMIKILDSGYENLPVLYNLIIVALMIIRHRLASTIKDLPESTLEIFFSHCIQLLKIMHHSGPSKDKVKIFCYHDQWEEVSEYWLLCMQVLSVCAVKLSWFPALVLSSKWLPYICNMLLSIDAQGIPIEILTAYGELLIGLTKANPTTMIVIKEAGGLQLARKYKMKSLQSLF